MQKAERQNDPETEQREIKKIQRTSGFSFNRKPTETILEEMKLQERPQERPEEIKIEDIPSRLGLGGQQSISQSTRSQGPATIGQETTADIVDPQGNLIFKGTWYELAGKNYTTPEYVLNLIKHARSNDVKNFKNAHEQRQKEKGINVTFTNQKFTDQAIEILEQSLNNDKHKIALVMDNIIKNNQNNIFKEFVTKYNRDYAKYLNVKKS